MPFDDNDPKDRKPRKTGLKINNATSNIQAPKPDPTVSLDQAARQVLKQNEDYKMRMLDLSSKFKAMIQDKVLPENKGIIVQDLEKEVLDKLIVVASEMNDDENQPEGLGGVALSMLLMKMLLLQRDTINTLHFKIDKLEKSQRQLEQTGMATAGKKTNEQ